MKLKRLSVLTLVFIFVLGIMSVPQAMATENMESAAFASVDFSTYKNNSTNKYPDLTTFDVTEYGSDYNSEAFGDNPWLSYRSSGGWKTSNKSYIMGWNKAADGNFSIANNSYLNIRAYNNSAVNTAVHRTFATPISVDTDKTYYLKFKAAMTGTAGTANQMRLGVIKSSNTFSGDNKSYEVDVFGGLKLNADDSTYRAQVSLDQGTTTATGTTTYTLGTTYNFLMRLDIDADSTDTLRMKVYGENAAEPANWEVTTTGDLGTGITLDKLCMDVFDASGTQLNVYTIDIEAYDTALLDDVVPQVDAKFANFKYSEADTIEETIKTLPIGMIRISYEAKLAALKEANDTTFLREDFNYTPTNATGAAWSEYGGEFYNTKINTIGTGGTGWKDAWSLSWNRDNESVATNTRFQYTGTDTYLMAYNGSTQSNRAYRPFASAIDDATNGEYYFVFDAEVGDQYESKYSIIDCRFALGASGTDFGYAGLKYVGDGLYAQLNVGGTTSYGLKKYDTTNGLIYRFIVKLEVENGQATMKLKVFPKNSAEPATWELVKTGTAMDIGYLNFYVPANSSVGIYDLWAEKYLNDNLAASKELAAGIAAGRITEEAEVEAAITGGFAQNEYLAALNVNTAPLLGSDISYNSATHTASLKMHNSRNADATIQPILALYNGSDLVGVTTGDVQTLTAKTRDQQVSVTFDSTRIPATYTSVKVFIWNNMLNLVPMLEAWEYIIPTV